MFCKKKEYTTIKKEDLKNNFNKYPIFLKIQIFDLELIKSFQNKEFEELILDTHIIVKYEDNKILIGKIEFFINTNNCPFLKNNKCILNKKPQQCLTEEQIKFYPIKNYQDILERLNINNSDINVNSLKEEYKNYFDILKKVSNHPFILKNFQIILESNLDKLLDLVERNHYTQFYSPIVNFEDFKDLMDIDTNLFKKTQKRILKKNINDLNSVFQQLYLSALNFY